MPRVGALAVLMILGGVLVGRTRDQPAAIPAHAEVTWDRNPEPATISLRCLAAGSDREREVEASPIGVSAAYTTSKTLSNSKALTCF